MLATKTVGLTAWQSVEGVLRGSKLCIIWCCLGGCICYLDQRRRIVGRKMGLHDILCLTLVSVLDAVLSSAYSRQRMFPS